MAASRKGRHADGGNLYLLIGDHGRRSWTFFYRDPKTGRLKERGLGPAIGPGKDGLSLAEARARAAELRALIRDGGELPSREEPQAAATFGEFAESYVASIRAGFKNAKHAAQWSSTLRTYCNPLWEVPIGEIGVEHVVAVLRPIWLEKPETASRVRGRIERVLSAAKVRGLRSGENPAQWKGTLDHLLPRRRRLTRGHHAALPVVEIPSFMAALRARRSVSARALEFAILCAARTGETLGATWPEIDWQARVWTIPASRMKAGKEHRVPLCDRAVDILREMFGPNWRFVFPGARPGAPLSQMAMAECLKDLRPDVTVHGFRSTFRDWAADVGGYPRELCEEALAHIAGSVERAYRRSDALERRRGMMNAWAAFCLNSNNSSVC